MRELFAGSDKAKPGTCSLMLGKVLAGSSFHVFPMVFHVFFMCPVSLFMFFPLKRMVFHVFHVFRVFCNWGGVIHIESVRPGIKGQATHARADGEKGWPGQGWMTRAGQTRAG